MIKPLLLRFSITVLAFGAMVHPALAQGSDQERIDGYAAFIRIAGFLKYYHPAFTSGALDWDAVFIENYPHIAAASDPDARNTFLAHWMDTLGDGIGQYPVSASRLRTADKNIEQVRQLLAPLYINDSIRLRINRIFLCRQSDSKSHYMAKHSIGYPEPQHERSYDTMRHFPEAWRMLTLARFWNIVQYYYPYRNLLDRPWDSVLTASIPDFGDNSRPYGLAISNLVAKVNDSHCGVVYRGAVQYPGRTLYRLPVDLQYVDGGLIVSRITDEALAGADFRPGDRILSIDGKSADSLLIPFARPIPSSNLAAYYRELVKRLPWAADTIADVELLHAGQPKKLRAHFYAPLDLDRNPEADTQSYLPHFMIADRIACIVPSRIPVGDMTRVVKRYRHCEGIVFDLRTYPELSYYAMTEALADRRQRFARFFGPDYTRPGMFETYSYPSCGRTIWQGWKRRYAGRVAILADGNTQSRGEFTVMALQTFHNAKVIGSQTAGTDGDAVDIVLPGGYHTKLTLYGVSYPDGTTTQRSGVRIDIAARNTAADYRDRKDAVMERALQYLRDGH